MKQGTNWSLVFRAEALREFLLDKVLKSAHYAVSVMSSIQSHSDVVGIGCCLGDNGICRDGIRYVRLTANDTCARWSCVSKEQTTLRSTTYTAFDGLVHVLLRDRIHCLGRVTR